MLPHQPVEELLQTALFLRKHRFCEDRLGQAGKVCRQQHREGKVRLFGNCGEGVRLRVLNHQAQLQVFLRVRLEVARIAGQLLLAVGQVVLPERVEQAV